MWVVPRVQHGQPLLGAHRRDERRPHLACLRVQLRVLDAEPPHHARRKPRAVAGDRKLVVLANDLALLNDGRRSGQRLAGQEGPGVAEDPRIADAAAGYGHAVHAGLQEHALNVINAEDVAAAEDGFVAGAALGGGQEIPVAAARVALPHRAGMDGDRVDAELERRVENPQEVLPALGRVVQAAAHLDSHRHVPRNRRAHGPYDLDGCVRRREQEAAAVSSEHLLDRAAEVEVDHVIAAFDEDGGGLGELAGLGPHELPAHGVIVGPQRAEQLLPRLE